MKTTGVMLLLVLAIGMASVEADNLKKRFFINDGGDKTDDTYNTAKKEFEQEGSSVKFDDAVNALIPYIHSDMTVFACTGACIAAAPSVLGPAAPLSAILCPPLCDGALAKLEEIAANGGP